MDEESKACLDADTGVAAEVHCCGRKDAVLEDEKG